VTVPTVEPELVFQKLAQLQHAKALRDGKWDACNAIGKRLIDWRIDQLCHDLQKLGAEDQVREILG
jgi:hypothetical protein